MSNTKTRSWGGLTPFMVDYRPLKTLWDGPGAPYPSEPSARWAVRKMRDDLAQAGAVALHRNRMFVHPQKFAQVAERSALQEFCERASRNHEDQ